MSLTRAEVDHIAKLARLKLTDKEKEKYRLQLSAVLDYVAQLQELDTKNIPGEPKKPDFDTKLREDTPGTSLSLEQVFENSPEHLKKQFKVPPVFG
jgi:aspartyl-tRNA(Asn)/glutamyl-tRNA(Gln) amidotransferase subunit C